MCYALMRKRQNTPKKKKTIQRKKEGGGTGFRLSSSQARPRWVEMAVAEVTGQVPCLRVQSTVGAQARLDHTGTRWAHSSMASQPGSSHTGHLGK